MALDFLSFTLDLIRTWTGKKNRSDGLKAAQQADRIAVSVALGTTANNNAAGGADEMYQTTLSIAGGGSTTIDLTSLTDILNQSTVSLARIKCVIFELLTTAQDGSAASSITLAPDVSNGHDLWLAGTAPEITLNNGEGTAWWTNAAAGRTVDSTHKVVDVTNNDGSVTAKVRVTVIGGST